MITRTLRIDVRKEGQEQAAEITRAFVDEVSRKEGGVASYRCYRAKETPTRFLHVMTFRVASAVEYHKGTAWNKKFSAALAPLCATPPVEETWDELG